MQVSILYAFFAGIISFLSACVLPLVPGYVLILSRAWASNNSVRASQPATVCSHHLWYS